MTNFAQQRPLALRPHRERLNEWDVRLAPYVFVSPFFILFVIVGVFPLLYTAWVSLHDWSLIGGQGDFVGMQNYEKVLTNPVFWIALRNTFSIFLLSVVPQLFFATLIAVALSANLRAKTFWRMGVLLPYVVAPVAVALIFGNLFGDQFGLINDGLRFLGLSPIAWHADALASHFAISTMVNFRWTGYNALILLAAIQAVPQELYDAGSIDGAGKIRSFFSITLPSIRPTMIFVIVTATVGGLQIFDEPRLFDQKGVGGANNQWVTLTMYIYNLGWGQSDFGRASAVAFLLLGIIVVIGLMNFGISRLIATDTKRPRKTISQPVANVPAVAARTELTPVAGRET